MHPVCAGLIALAIAAPPAPTGDGVPVSVRSRGVPAAGVSVWAFRGRDDAGAPLVTDKAGVVRVPGSLFGGEPKVVSVFARAPDGRVGGAVLYGRPAEPAAFELLATAAWSGRVTGPDGKPVAGVTVAAVEFSGPPAAAGESPGYVPTPPGGTYRRVTGADGTFAFDGVPAGGTVDVSLKIAGRVELRAFAPAAKPFAVTLADPGGVRLVLPAADAAAAKGMTYSLDGPAPAKPDAPADGPPQFRASTFGKFDGTAALAVPGLPPGDYELSLRGGGAVPVTAAKPKLTVAVKAGATADVRVELVKLVRATGRVVDAATGQPVAGAKVGVEPAERNYDPTYPYATVETDADGRYVSHAPPGRSVTARPGSTAGAKMAAGYLDPTYQAGVFPLAPVKLTPAGHTFPDIKLRKSATFTALVVGADDKPVAAATVYPARINDNTSPRELASGADGLVRLPDLDPADLIALRARRGDAVNVPEPVEIGGPDRQTVRLAKENAFAVAGRIVDTAGKPVPGAKVALHWSTRGVGKDANMGTSRTFETLTPGVDGKFRSSALWPGDRYWVVVTAPGFGTAQSDEVKGVAGATHAADVTLVPANLAVRGRVVDLGGKPVAGVTVFQRSDGEAPTETKSAADGTFALAGYRPGPAYVFATHPGHRLGVAPADPASPAGAAVTLTLRKTTDAPAPPPDVTAHRAALDALTREVFAAMWKDRAKLDGYDRLVFPDFIRFDPAAAKLAADEAKRAGDKTDYAVTLARAAKDAKLLGVAKADPEEAVALLSNRTGEDGCLDVIRLGHQLRRTEPGKALTLAEDAVQRARTLDMPVRAYYLARAGHLAARCGNAAGGRAIVLEAADLAGPIPLAGRNGALRGTVAAELAAFDRPRALKMIDAHKATGDANRYLSQAVDRVAIADPAGAEKMLADLTTNDGSFDHHEARMFVAYRLAATDPDGAARVMAGVTYEDYRVLGYYKLARLAAATDKARAWKLLDAAFAGYDAVPTEYDSGTYSGGRSALLAVGAVVARDVGYPDVAGVVARALLLRPSAADAHDPKMRVRQTAKIALALSFCDPAAARRVLASVAPADEFARRAAGGQREDLFVAAFVAPEHAMKAIAPRLATFADGRSGLIELFDALAAADRLASASRWESLPRVNNEWEE